MKNKELELSIIIPAYNAEKYILKNIKRIEKIVNNCEIIIVDDGSNDNTLNILKNIQSENIIVVNKENGGVSSARNMGIDVAKGKYILFLDADDILFRSVNRAIKLAIKNKCDIVKCDYNIQRKIKCIYKKVHCIKKQGKGKIDKNIIYDLIISDYTFNSACGQIIKRELLSDLNFDSKYIMAEDLDFNMKLYTKANNIYYFNKPIFLYCYNEKSATRDTNLEKYKKQLLDIVEVYSKMYSYIKKWKLPATSEKTIKKHIENTVENLMKSDVKNEEELKKYYETCKKEQRRE